jgi:hypothetical protein
MEVLAVLSAHLAKQALVAILEPHILSCSKWLLRRHTPLVLPGLGVLLREELLRAMGQQLLLEHCPQLAAKRGR